MAVTVVKTIGTTSRTFSTLQAWEDGAPVDLTTAEQWAAGTFIGTFQQGETVTGTGLTAGKFLDTNGTSSITFGIVTGNTATLTTLTGATSGATCIVSSKTTTGVVWQGQCYNDSVFSGAGPKLTIAGSTNSATAYKELTTGAGQSFRDNANVQTNALRYNTANGVSITSTGNYASGSTILVQENNVRISKLQVEKNGNSCCISDNAAAPTNALIEFCIFESNGTTNATINHGGGGAGWAIRNCLILNRAATAATYIADTQSGISYYNCTIASTVAVATSIFQGNYGTSTVENCAVFNATSVKASGSTTMVYTTSRTSVASPPSGFTTIAYDTSTGSGFQNITDATRDYRIKSTSAMLDVGTTDATNAAIDIAGTSRPQGSAYDIGCWELVATAASFIANKPIAILQAVKRASYF